MGSDVFGSASRSGNNFNLGEKTTDIFAYCAKLNKFIEANLTTTILETAASLDFELRMGFVFSHETTLFYVCFRNLMSHYSLPQFMLVCFFIYATVLCLDIITSST